MNRLWVVMPVYNEQGHIAAVVEEWLSALRAIGRCFTLCLVNDGSGDGTRGILETLASANQELRVVDKPHSGHGQTCIEGYRTALAQHADWILQVDSDGQCDPSLLPRFAAAAACHPVVYGFRRERHDGSLRLLISRAVSVCVFAATGVWVRDANVPYRLMHASTLTDALGHVPPDFHLANVLIAVLQQERHGIHWIGIHFRQRSGGTSSVPRLGFVTRGAQLFRQLRRVRRSDASERS